MNVNTQRASAALALLRDESAALAGAAWRGLLPRRLSGRIAAVFLVLLLILQLLSLSSLRTLIKANAEAQMQRELDVAARIWTSELNGRINSVALGSSLLARDAGFVQAAGMRDAPTIESALESLAGRIDAGLSAAVDTQGALLAVHPADDAAARRSLQQVVKDMHPQHPQRPQQLRSAVTLLGVQPYLVVSSPLPRQIGGHVLMGFALDRALLDNVHHKSSAHVALLSTQTDGSIVVVGSTLPAVQHAALSGGSAQGQRVVLDGETMVVRRVRLTDQASAHVLLLGSIDEAMKPYLALQRDLLWITLAGLALFALAGKYVARRVTTPLRSLVRASERLGRGDYELGLQHVEREDEVGELARAFDHMRVNIAGHQKEIRQLAYWDRLTGLPNRAQFRAALQQAVESGQAGAVAMLDLDRFKHVNDVMGFAFGDLLLKAVGERLAAQVLRPGDMVARLSGDEFALLLPCSDSAQALVVAQRMASALALPLTLQEQTVDLSAGIGIACWPLHGIDADVLLSRAEVAMYAAKRKLAVALLYDPAIDSGSAETLSLLSELRRAIEHNELRLFLQPKMALHDGAMVGAEALVRWMHPQRGMVPPMEFIPFAEQTGFVRQLTLWMLEATASRWHGLSALGLQRVSVNLSTRDLMDPDLPERIAAILRRHAVPATAICLEITESAIMDEPQRAEATLNVLAAAGHRLSIDDFGTGYSSLAYLKRLPVHELKIDKSFVMNMEHDVADAKIVRSTIDLAHNMGLEVVAEGVENQAAWDALALLGCDEAQGYHMAKPMAATEMAAFAARWKTRALAQTPATAISLPKVGQLARPTEPCAS